MRPSTRDPSSATGPEPSRAEVRQQFLAACAASSAGPPPDPDAFVASFAEPERSALRDELALLQRTHGGASKGPPPGTAAEAADDTRESVPTPDGTVDHVPPQPQGTVDHAPAPEGTVDHVPRKPRAQDLPLPASVAGYEVLGVLGRGAMGVVYKARQRGLKRLVALKMILAGAHASALDLARFRAEANAVAQLQHPGIVQIYEVGEDDGRPFFSLEFVDGLSLHKKIQGTPLPPREAAALLQQMAAAMAYAHRHGVIHRDLKPANVLMTGDGVPKIGDFGLAKRIEDEDESGLTRTGTVLGTPSYMSPEQAEGLGDQVGPLADVYSLGAILYDMLTGRPPFRGTSVLDTLEQLRTREPVPPMQFQPSVPRDLETICLKCLQKDRTKRYTDAGALADDLKRFLSGEPIQARPVSRAERVWRWCRRNPGKAFASAAAVLGVMFYLLSVSVLAGLLKVEKDAADQSAAYAIEQRGIADQKTEIAIANEKREKRTAAESLKGMVAVVDRLQNLMQSKRMMAASDEVRKFRADMLIDLRKALVEVSQNMRAVGDTTFADLVAAQLIGDMLVRLGQIEEARRVFEAGRAAAKRRAEDEPNNDLARANLGVMEQRLGEIALDMEGDARTAMTRFHESRRLHEEIRRAPRDGSLTAMQNDAAVSHDDIHLGRALLALGQPRAARLHFQVALELREGWLKAVLALANEPDEVIRRTLGLRSDVRFNRDILKNEPTSYLVQARMYLGTAAWQLDDAAGTEQHFGAALTLCRELLKRHPDRLPYKEDMTDVLGAYGDALVRLGKTTEARHRYRESLGFLNDVLAKKPDDIAQRPRLALAYERLGTAAVLLKDEEEAKRHFKLAYPLRNDLWELEQSNLARQVGFVATIARVGDYKEAVRLATKIGPNMVKSTELTLQVARCFALCAEGGADRQKNVAAALNALTTATGGDYQAAVVLATDPDLRVLRDEPGFKELLARIKAR